MDSTATTVVKQISEALARDPRTHKSVIDIGFNQGVVVLTGKVKTAAEVQAVEEIARSQPDVLSVVNEVRVG